MIKGSKAGCLLSALAAVLSVIPAVRGDFGLVQGDYYSSNYFSNVITQYGPTGAVVGSYTVPSALGSEVRGLAFGSDNLLYATLSRGSSGFAVVALDGSGMVHMTYTGSTYVAGNLSYGKISVDSQYLYVSGQDQLTRFLLGNPASGTTIYTANQVYDTKPLANGNLFVASAYKIDEITNTGVFVRTIPLIGDGNFYTDIRGIEYDPATNSLFVTELGHTGFFDQLMRLDATTGVLQNNVTFNYADDIFLDSSGKLLVGSRTQTPAFFSQNLQQAGALGDGQQMFVTQFVPEPATISYLLLVAAAAVFVRRLRVGQKARSSVLTQTG
ncbi:MAG: PEP-CTERM sorting domain-containing protein [Verrucomicrobiota bacterium]